MGYFTVCPTCGNTHEGDQIIRCGKCGQIQCERCTNRMPTLLLTRYECFNCKNPWRSGVPNHIVGYIKPMEP